MFHGNKFPINNTSIFNRYKIPLDKDFLSFRQKEITSLLQWPVSFVEFCSIHSQSCLVSRIFPPDYQSYWEFIDVSKFTWIKWKDFRPPWSKIQSQSRSAFKQPWVKDNDELLMTVLGRCLRFLQVQPTWSRWRCNQEIKSTRPRFPNCSALPLPRRLYIGMLIPYHQKVSQSLKPHPDEKKT